MAGPSPVTAMQEQTAALRVLSRGADRAEADRAPALLLTLEGWTSARIAQAFGVRQDRVRLWRGAFAQGAGPVPVKAEAALRVAVPLLSAPVEDRRTWTFSRLEGGIARREDLRISRSQLSKVLRKRGVQRAKAPAQPEGPPMRGGG
jgi:transposase